MRCNDWTHEHQKYVEKVNDLTLKLEQEKGKNENYDKHLCVWSESAMCIKVKLIIFCTNFSFSYFNFVSLFQLVG